MLYVRALESDFVKWDVEGFNYSSAVETWKATENYESEPLPDWHSRGGPISTAPPQFVDEARRAELEMRFIEELRTPSRFHACAV